MLYNARNYRKAPHGMTEYLTVDEVAKMLQVSRVTVYTFINSGKLESIKIGKSRRITRAAVEQFMRDNVDRKAKH